MKKNNDTLFYEGAIPSTYASKVIELATQNNKVGAHNIFMGQVRADQINNDEVIALSYSTQINLAINEYNSIINELHTKFKVSNVHVKHSNGLVKTGEICLFIFISSEHRTECQVAMDWLIESVKNRLPIFA